MTRAPRLPRLDGLAAAVALLLGLAVFMPMFEPVFRLLYPALERPVYGQDPLWLLLLAHLGLVAAASLAAAAAGLGAAVLVTRGPGRAFRPLLDTVTAVGQTVPPVAVLALAVPAVGFGAEPALIALALYGILPIYESAVAGLEGVPASVREAADGIGMTPLGRLMAVDLPLAAPVVLGGLRSSVTIAIGTATIASTVGARTLGSPIIVGLNGFNGAYVVQGAVLVALLAIAVDLAFERLQGRFLQARFRG